MLAVKIIHYGIILSPPPDPQISFFSSWQWGVITVSLVLTGVLEAYTLQIDNLILSLFHFSLLTVFL